MPPPRTSRSGNTAAEALSSPAHVAIHWALALPRPRGVVALDPVQVIGPPVTSTECRAGGKDGGNDK
ncbi:MAG: hypothetical protein JO179_00590 [Solirubrobacterales bacterium]|nr:hypothetical protein [Solirubrobacterales bacterium]